MAADSLRTRARSLARRQGHRRLSAWRLVPVPTRRPVLWCRCRACGAELIYRSELPITDDMVSGTALTTPCPGAATPAPGALIPAPAPAPVAVASGPMMGRRRPPPRWAKPGADRGT